MKSLRLYVAGPMSGIPHLNHPEFDRITDLLRALGHEVFSPAEKDREWGQDEQAAREGRNSLNMTDVLRWDLQKILECDGIVLLPNWRKSEGARLEVIVAISTGRKVFSWGGGLTEVPLQLIEDLPGIPNYVWKKVSS
jgi:hypothetical protein